MVADYVLFYDVTSCRAHFPFIAILYLLLLKRSENALPMKVWRIQSLKRIMEIKKYKFYDYVKSV